MNRDSIQKSCTYLTHLQNTLTVITDRKLQTCGSEQVLHYEAQVISVSDYYPFGMQMTGREWQSEEYRFGFNGKESDNEMSGNGNVYDYGFRIYNPRIGKFLSVDPLTDKYPWYSPYQFAGNMPLLHIDIDGLEEFDVITNWDEKAKGYITKITLLNTEGDLKLNVVLTGPHGKVTTKTTTQYLSKKMEDRATQLKENKNFVMVQYREMTDVEKKLNPPVKKKATTAISADKTSPANPPGSKKSDVTHKPTKKAAKANPPPPFICFTCFTGASYDHKEEQTNNVAKWLIENPGYKIVIKIDGGYVAGRQPKNPKWSDKVSGKHSPTRLERRNEDTEILQRAVSDKTRGHGNPQDRIKFMRGDAEGKKMTVLVVKYKKKAK